MFLLYGRKVGVGSGGGERRGRERDDFLACDGDISLKIRIKPPKNYLSVELNKQSHKSYSGFYCTKKMLTLNAISNSGATLQKKKNLDRVYFRKDGYQGQGKNLANS